MVGDAVDTVGPRQISQPVRTTDPSVCQRIVVFPGAATRKLSGPVLPRNKVDCPEVPEVMEI
jgi:hypothetical protein